MPGGGKESLHVKKICRPRQNPSPEHVPLEGRVPLAIRTGSPARSGRGGGRGPHQGAEERPIGIPDLEPEGFALQTAEPLTEDLQPGRSLPMPGPDHHVAEGKISLREFVDRRVEGPQGAVGGAIPRATRWKGAGSVSCAFRSAPSIVLRSSFLRGLSPEARVSAASRSFPRGCPGHPAWARASFRAPLRRLPKRSDIPPGAGALVRCGPLEGGFAEGVTRAPSRPRGKVFRPSLRASGVISPKISPGTQAFVAHAADRRRSRSLVRSRIAGLRGDREVAGETRQRGFKSRREHSPYAPSRWWFSLRLRRTASRV
jgi:hypothetical protein